MWINREYELAALEERWNNNKAEFIVIYGRRRIGKSELIEKFIKGKRGVRLLAREESETLQLQRFSKKLALLFRDALLEKNPLASWDAFFELIAEKAKERLVIALDEFPYLCKENPALPSIIQDYWDNRLKETKIFLILSGSSVSMMEKKVLRHKSPLYGRRSAQFLLRPFTFRDVFLYLGMPIEEAIETYSVFGGTPAYVIEFEKKKDLFWNIKSKIFRDDSFLYRDIEFLLREGLKEPRYYFSVLSSVAKGNTKISDIINDTGLKKSIVGKYLSILSELYLVRREVPITENPLRSRKGIYILYDNYFKFWFRYVYPNKEEIERRMAGYLIENTVKPSFSRFVSFTFEDVCREALSSTTFAMAKIGRWWDRGSEIDIVGLNENEKSILFAECEWSKNVDARQVLADLRKKAEMVDWNIGKRTEYYAVFAKSFKKKFKEKDVFLFDLNDLERIFRKKKE